MEVKYITKWCLSTIIWIQTAGMMNILALERGRSRCDYNFYFDNQSKDCLECPLGSFGLNCSQRCILGFYGRLCQFHCECNAQNCSPANGCQISVTSKEHVSIEVTETRQQTEQMSTRLQTPMDISTQSETTMTVNMSTQSGTPKDMSTLKKENSTSKFSSQSSISDDPTVQHHKSLTQSKAPTKMTQSTPSEKPKEAKEFPTSEKTSTESSEQNNPWMLVALILIALIAVVFIGGVFIYLNSLKFNCRIRSGCHARTPIQDHANVNIQQINKNTQQRDTPRTCDEESQDYDEIRKSQINQQFNHSTGISIEFRRENGASAFRSSYSQKQSTCQRISFNCDNSIVLLKQRQSAAIYEHDWRSTGLIFWNDEEYVTSRGSRISNSPGTIEDYKFQTLPLTSDFSGIKREKRPDCSNRLIRSSSESLLTELKYAFKVGENGVDTFWNEEELPCEDDSIILADRPSSDLQENIQRECQSSDLEEKETKLEITKL